DALAVRRRAVARAAVVTKLDRQMRSGAAWPPPCSAPNLVRGGPPSAEPVQRGQLDRVGCLPPLHPCRRAFGGRAVLGCRRLDRHASAVAATASRRDSVAGLTAWFAERGSAFRECRVPQLADQPPSAARISLKKTSVFVCTP